MRREDGTGRRRTAMPAVLAIAAVLGAAAVAAAQSQAPPKAPLSLRLTSARQAQPLETPAWEADGAVLFPLRAAVEYCGGSVSWYPARHKALIEGPQGRKVVLAPGYPKCVLDGRLLVRLPQAPVLRQSQLVITPEAFLVLWKHLADEAPVYLPEDRLLRIGIPSGVISGAPGVKPPAESAGSNPAEAAATDGLRAIPAPAEKTSLCIVVDPGHGGKDPGAVGPTRAFEKDAVLEIAIQLAALLEKEAGCKVILTRSDDRFIPLPERAEIANQAEADLFVSIHANASLDRNASGSQVFIYNREASSRKAAETARLENRDANYLEIIKDDLRQSVHEADSITAAGLVSQELEKDGMEARRIERAPFYVLAKSHMPSILVETAFISNRKEERKLRSRPFCRQIARDIFGGLQRYTSEKRKAGK